jgi:YHS domain-containing protein
MFVDVELPVTLSPSIVVPADAVVDAGLRQTVYVAKADGVFEPRKVETGWRAGDQVEIVKGLMVGEKIVVSGTFLIDSESRMKAAAAGIYGESSECPVCGMEVDITKAKAAGLTSEFRGQTYYFCADDDKAKFDKEPTRYAWKSDKGPTTAAGKRLSETQWEGGKGAPSPR